MSAAAQAAIPTSSAALPRWMKYASIWTLMAIMGWVDLVTGSELSAFVLYTLPIFLMSWIGSWRSGVLIAVACAVVWWCANRAESNFLTWWGFQIAAGSRLIMFVMVAVASSVFKSKRDLDRARIEALERTRELEQEIVRVSEREQRRIGQDLHDGLCQHLAAIGFAAKSLADDLEKCGRPETGAAQEIEALLKGAVVEARDLARGMFPVQVDGAGLSAALEGLAATTTRLTSAQVFFVEIGEAQISDAATAMHLYRIAQESVANAIKHAKAKRVYITLEGTQDTLRLKIEDDGEGFFGKSQVLGGMGLRTMAYRARQIGATLELQERDGPGTCVYCELRPAGHAAQKPSKKS